MRTRSLAPWLLGLLTLLAVPACTSAPPLPIPPPAIDAVSIPDAEGLVTVRGTGNADVFVGCINAETREGVIAPTDAVGRFELQIPAARGDTLLLFQLTDDGRGALVERLVGGPRPDGGP